MRRWILRGAWSAVAVAGLFGLASGCSSSERDGDDDDDDEPDELEWVCSESREDCTCDAVKPNVDVSRPGVSVDVCSAHDCCLLSEVETQFSEAACECFFSEAACEAEAASRPGTEVVAQCPPGAGPAACAASGENCTPEYLDRAGLRGCCQGLLCRPNEAAVPVCQPGSAEELALYEQCTRVARSSDRQVLEVLTPSVRTSHGELALDSVSTSFVGVGPHGCLNDLSIAVGSGGFGCSLTFDVSVVNGAFAWSGFSATLIDCAGFTGELSDGLITNVDQVPFGFSFQAVACDARLIFESYCVAGTFDFHLTGTVGAITFEDQHLLVNGVICSAEPAGECPAG